jgi:predicted metalloprotease with PDZ domain
MQHLKCLFSLTAVTFLLSFTTVIAQSKYEITADLSSVKKDKVKVVVKTPLVTAETVDWVVPKMIPGSYSVKDFGRFVEGFTALDEKGKKLPVKKDGNNVFTISDATRLKRIEYFVNDTWDAENDNFIFQPGGTNIEAGKNFVINHQGFWGYLEGFKMIPYEITIIKPNGFYGSTALQKKSENATKDVFYAQDFVRLVDNPVMYCIPDTISFLSGKTRVNISVYSATGVVKSAQIKEILTPLASSLTRFFGQMPVSQYHFIMYFPEAKKSAINQFGGYGALEHSFSSMYFLPEMASAQRLKSMVLSIAAHEFLHILTPLNIHSKEIANFDFRNPVMSQHLWMYEGITEYFADLIQVRNELTTYREFQNEISSKIASASKFQDVSFTEMSRNILTPEFKEMYMNVYFKGALFGLLLDIRLHELSEGKMSLKDLMLRLSEQFGPDRPFEDNELIDIIVAESYPEIGLFFDQYIIGNTPLPFEEYFYKVGWNFYPEQELMVKTYGDFKYKLNEKSGRCEIIKTESNANVFGFENGDEILEINAQLVTIDNYDKLLKPIATSKIDGELTMKFKRRGVEMVSKASPIEKLVMSKFVIEDVNDVSEIQLNLRSKIFFSNGEH